MCLSTLILNPSQATLSQIAISNGLLFKGMKEKTTIYWIATVFVAGIMTASGVFAVSHAPPLMKALAHLGYPAYFSNLLGIGKLLGVCVLLAPGWGKLKEWAYAGFGITIISAAYSHLSSGDGLLALEPLVSSPSHIVT
jgi:hypothetical protein